MKDMTTIAVSSRTRQKLSHIKNSHNLDCYDTVINRLIDEKYPRINDWIKKFLGK